MVSHNSVATAAYALAVQEDRSVARRRTSLEIARASYQAALDVFRAQDQAGDLLPSDAMYIPRLEESLRMVEALRGQIED